MMYQYKAIIRNVVDGDTYIIDIDLGLSVWVRGEKVRLYGVNTPEIYGVKKGSEEWQKGTEASNFAKSIVHEGDEVLVDTVKDKKEKYGRYLAVMYLKVPSAEIDGLENIRSIDDYYCLNDILVRRGFAEEYML
jgi:micrococcal nuclease